MQRLCERASASLCCWCTISWEMGDGEGDGKGDGKKMEVGREQPIRNHGQGTGQTKLCEWIGALHGPLNQVSQPSHLSFLVRAFFLEGYSPSSQFRVSGIAHDSALRSVSRAVVRHPAGQRGTHYRRRMLLIVFSRLWQHFKSQPTRGEVASIASTRCKSPLPATLQQ